MSLSARRLRSIGWLALLAVCATLVLVLTLRVNALRSQVRREENRIVALREETLYLQTEFETRASQQQLKAWNDVDFGYVAPAAGQYLENERKLAMLGKPAAPDAPAPVQLAELGDSASGLGGGAATSILSHGASAPGSAAVAYSDQSFSAMVSPLTGKPASGAVRSDAVMRAPGAERLLAAEHTEGPSTAGGADSRVDHAAATAALGERLGRVDHGGPGKAVHKPAAKGKANANAAAKSKVAAGLAVTAAHSKLKKARPAAPKSDPAKPQTPTSHKRDHKPTKHSSEKPA